MEMAQIRYFIAVCEEKSFSGAARKCGVAQPSLSKAIKQLERKLGGELFQRNGRSGVALTDLGRKVEPHLRIIWLSASAIDDRWNKDQRSSI